MIGPETPPLSPKSKVPTDRSENSDPLGLTVRVTRAIGPVLALGGLIAALILSFGWSYAWHWFAHWQVPLASLELGPDLLLEYGRLVVVYFWWLAILWLLVISAAGLGLNRINASDAQFTILIVAAFLIPWLSSHYLGAKRAEASVSEAHATNFGGLSEVHMILRPEHTAALPESIRTSLSTGPNLCYRLLFRSSDGLWLVRLDRSGHPGAAVFLPHESVLYLRLRRPRGGNC